MFVEDPEASSLQPQASCNHVTLPSGLHSCLYQRKTKCSGKGIKYRVRVCDPCVGVMTRVEPPQRHVFGTRSHEYTCEWWFPTAHGPAIPVLRLHQILNILIFGYQPRRMAALDRPVFPGFESRSNFEYAGGIWYLSGQAVTDPIGLKGIPTLRKVLTPRALKPLVLWDGDSTGLDSTTSRLKNKMPRTLVLRVETRDSIPVSRSFRLNYGWHLRVHRDSSPPCLSSLHGLRR